VWKYCHKHNFTFTEHPVVLHHTVYTVKQILKPRERSQFEGKKDLSSNVTR